MKRFLKWTGRGLAGLVVLIALALGVAYGVSAAQFGQTYEVTPAAPPIPADAEAVARGRHAVTIRACGDCHGADFAGKVMVDDPALGRIVSRNLTPGGRTASWDGTDWDRAIRHGVGPDGRPLLVMPSEEYHALSDGDLADIVAYLQTLPAVENELPEMRVGPLGRALIVAGEIKLAARVIDHAAERSAAPMPGPTAEYGAYLAVSCQGCHGEGFAGKTIVGAPPGAPPAADLTSAGRIGQWSAEDFAQTLRTGVRPDGSRLDPFMPWEAMTKPMTDDELTALYLYFRQLPAAPSTSS